jgi:hypothetical protein
MTRIKTEARLGDKTIRQRETEREREMANDRGMQFWFG